MSMLKVLVMSQIAALPDFNKKILSKTAYSTWLTEFSGVAYNSQVI